MTATTAGARGAVFIATSLDGFIARADGSLDWLEGAEAPTADGEDYGYQAFLDSVDGLLLGRRSFDKVLSLGDWPYGNKPVIVLSSRPLALPAHLPPAVRHAGGDPAELMRRLGREGLGRLYIDGGETIRRFLAAGLIDELTLNRVPRLLGAGIPLFGPLARDLCLEHQATRSYASGLVQSRYRVLP